MKQLNYFFLIVALALVFSSCKKDTSALSDSIPTDAFAVILFDTKSILTKADYNPMKNKSIQDLLEKEKEDNPEQIKKMEEFLKNPNSAGIDLLGNCMLYVSPETNGCLFKVNDAGKLKKTFIETLEISEDELIEEDGITIFEQGSKAALGWTKEKLLFVVHSDTYYYGDSDEDMVALLRRQLLQKSEESINSIPSFQQFLAKKKDISVYYSYENLWSLWGPTLGGMLKYYGLNVSNIVDLFDGLYMAGFASFEKGEIVFNQNFYFQNAEKEKKYKEFINQIYGKITSDDLKFFTDKPLFLVSANLKGEGLYNYMNDLGVISMIDKEFSSALKEKNLELKSLISNFNGDFTFLFDKMEEARNEYDYSNKVPKLALLAQLEDTERTLALIESLFASNSAEIEKTKNGFQVISEIGSIYLGIEGKSFYITNSESLFEDIISGATKKNDFASLAKGKHAFVYGNIHSLNQTIVEEMDTDDARLDALVIKGLNLLGDYSFSMGDNLESSGKIEITDRSANSLSVICKYFDELISYIADSM